MCVERNKTAKKKPKRDSRNRMMSDAPSTKNKSQPNGPAKTIIRAADSRKPFANFSPGGQRQYHPIPQAAHSIAAIQEKISLSFIREYSPTPVMRRGGPSAPNMQH